MQLPRLSGLSGYSEEYYYLNVHSQRERLSCFQGDLFWTPEGDLGLEGLVPTNQLIALDTPRTRSGHVQSSDSNCVSFAQFGTSCFSEFELVTNLARSK